MQSLPGPERTDAIDRLEARLCRKMGRTIETFRLIEPGDRIMVAMSGGKDSYALLTLLDRFRRRLPGPAVELIAFHLDQRQPGYDGEPLERWLENYGVEFRIHAQDTYSVVTAVAEVVLLISVLDCDGTLRPGGSSRLLKNCPWSSS